LLNFDNPFLATGGVALPPLVVLFGGDGTGLGDGDTDGDVLDRLNRLRKLDFCALAEVGDSFFTSTFWKLDFLRGCESSADSLAMSDASRAPVTELFRRSPVDFGGPSFAAEELVGALAGGGDGAGGSRVDTARGLPGSAGSSSSAMVCCVSEKQCHSRTRGNGRDGVACLAYCQTVTAIAASKMLRQPKFDLGEKRRG
jgi:hypothetical protein